MQRRKFIQTTALGIGFAYLSAFKLFDGVNGEKYPELKKHKIEKAELLEFDFHWPRHVGKNARRGVHGQFHKNEALKLTTAQGAIGWGLSSNKIEGQLNQLQGKFVSERISPENGMRHGLSQYMDLALHDLMGVILNKPVYELLGAKGTKNTPVYSGMIYFDELEPEANPSGISKIIENCQWDIDYGYQQLKVKIGRSGKWYPHNEGLKKDIEVVRLIHKTFPDIRILVDSNDQYTLQDTIEFLKGIGDIPLLWIEEPFRESYDDGKKLR
ncbi:MAG: mandelate racemase/muconate lactonizing protein, partial [Planctomycetes bacterium]|nr:mandelate racemase/muconate lactonizing protein [Planctomycetota bacterium]